MLNSIHSAVIFQLKDHGCVSYIPLPSFHTHQCEGYIHAVCVNISWEMFQLLSDK